MTAIRKNSNTGIILGVCSGLSEWSGTPVHLIRISMFVGFLASLSIVGWFYIFAAGILSDTAQCNLRQIPFKERIKKLFEPWWKKSSY